MDTPEEVLSYLDACIECNACADHCSIFLVTGAHDPPSKLNILRKLASSNELSKVERQSLFTCTKCEGCQSSCPQELPLIAMFDWGRHEIARKHGFINPKQGVVIDNILQSGNPFREEGGRFKTFLGHSEAHDERIRYHVDRESGSLLFLGCMAQYRIPQMAHDILDILDALHIDFTLDENESCCGYYIWNCGDHEHAGQIIEKNMEYLQQYDEVICACAGCYTFFRSNYPRNVRFTHVIEKIAERLPAFLEGRLSTVKRVVNANREKDPVLYHDSCHLTRPWGIITPPREVLRQLGYRLVEFSRNRKQNLCCGADGGMRFINKELAIKIGRSRVEEASGKAESMSTLCPFCIFNFKEVNAPEHPIEITSLYRVIQRDITFLLDEKAKINGITTREHGKKG